MPRPVTPLPKSNPLPLQFTPWRKEQFGTDEGVSFINQTIAQMINSINAGTGQAGMVVIPAGLDVAGGTVTGLGNPTGESDAVSLGHAQGNYSAPAVAPSLDIGGKNTLKGLAYVYSQVQQNGPSISALQAILAPGNGITGTITLAKLTGGGTEGSITVLNGIVTGFVNPT